MNEDTFFTIGRQVKSELIMYALDGEQRINSSDLIPEDDQQNFRNSIESPRSKLTVLRCSRPGMAKIGRISLMVIPGSSITIRRKLEKEILEHKSPVNERSLGVPSFTFLADIHSSSDVPSRSGAYLDVRTLVCGQMPLITSRIFNHCRPHILRESLTLT